MSRTFFFFFFPLWTSFTFGNHDCRQYRNALQCDIIAIKRSKLMKFVLTATSPPSHSKSILRSPYRSCPNTLKHFNNDRRILVCVVRLLSLTILGLFLASDSEANSWKFITSFSAPVLSVKELSAGLLSSAHLCSPGTRGKKTSLCPLWRLLWNNSNASKSRRTSFTSLCIY